MPVNQARLRQLTRQNQLQTALLMLAIGGLCALLAGWLGGMTMALVFGISSLAVVIFLPGQNPAFALRLAGVRVISPQQMPQLYQVLAELAERAELPALPQLAWMPRSELVAFTTGTRSKAWIVLSDGLLNTLSRREMVGVLAHEISHIRHNDIRVMALADWLSSLTRTLSWIGQITLLLAIPLFLFDALDPRLWPLPLLILTPAVSTLLQLALSRNREFLADASAVELMGDPAPLIEALQHLENQQRTWHFLVGRSEQPSMLRSHPLTAQRIERLSQLQIGRPRFESPL